MKTRVLSTTLLFMVFALAAAHAEGLTVKGNIPFQFMAAGKVLPAGDYELVPDLEKQVVRVEPSKGKGAGAIVVVVTRLASGMHSTPANAHLVFDKVGNTYTLSEVWLPNEDGYLLHVTEQKHEHHVLHVPR